MMKLSVSLLVAAFAAAIPAGVSADSLRGINERFDYANCDQKTDCQSYGETTCTHIYENAEGDCPNRQCRWNSNANKCVPNNNNDSSTDCRVGESYWDQDCGNNQWCMQLDYGLCGEKKSGTCSYFTGGATCSRNSIAVCGCDGVTYACESEAYNGGHNIRCEGACPCSNDEEGEVLMSF